MEIPFLDLKQAYKELQTELDSVWNELNLDSFYVLGDRLRAFEESFANYLGVKHVVGVANGLDALTLAIKALNISKGDEVIVPAHTFIASWLAVSACGATPVPVEIEHDSCLIDCEKIEKIITDRTRAIMPVHLYGLTCNMSAISEIAQRRNLKIIEDAAQAHGALDLSSGRKAGALGDAAGFSFYPSKNLGCFGDGGCLTTSDPQIYERAMLIRNYGSKQPYNHQIIGINSRLDELQAAILSVKLKYLEAWNDRRRVIAKFYIQELSEVGDLVLPTYNIANVWHIFHIRTLKRNQLQEYLTNNKIGTNIHYPKAIHLQPAYLHMNIPSGAFPIAESVCRETLSLPIGPHLSIEEAEKCVEAIKRFFLKK
jgi:dTDP-4-amino-4,6-dideoxygalactose transaminase